MSTSDELQIEARKYRVAKYHCAAPGCDNEIAESEAMQCEECGNLFCCHDEIRYLTLCVSCSDKLSEYPLIKDENKKLKDENKKLKDEALDALAKTAAATGEWRDLHAYLKARREKEIR